MCLDIRMRWEAEAEAEICQSHPVPGYYSGHEHCGVLKFLCYLTNQWVDQ